MWGFVILRSIVKTLSAIGLAAGIAAPISANATVITFDDISVASGSYVSVSNGYQGFNWSDVYAENNGGRGYSNGIVSQSNAGYNGKGTAASFTAQSGTFTFNSGYFTGAFSTENVSVTDNLGDSLTFSVNDTTPTLETFNWTGVTTVTIVAGPGGQGTQVVFDNLTVNANVPEPTSMATAFSHLTCGAAHSLIP